PRRVAPRNGRWTAKLTIAMVNERGEPSPVADDIPVRLRPTLGTVESEEVVIRKGTSIADVRITSDAPGCDTIYVLSSTAVNGPSAQVEYELPRPSRVSLSATSPAALAAAPRPRHDHGERGGPDRRHADRHVRAALDAAAPRDLWRHRRDAAASTARKAPRESVEGAGDRRRPRVRALRLRAVGRACRHAGAADPGARKPRAERSRRVSARVPWRLRR